jgi:hypothetical protein
LEVVQTNFVKCQSGNNKNTLDVSGINICEFRMAGKLSENPVAQKELLNNTSLVLSFYHFTAPAPATSFPFPHTRFGATAIIHGLLMPFRTAHCVPS